MASDKKVNIDLVAERIQAELGDVAMNEARFDQQAVVIREAKEDQKVATVGKMTAYWNIGGFLNEVKDSAEHGEYGALLKKLEWGDDGGRTALRYRDLNSYFTLEEAVEFTSLTKALAEIKKLKASEKAGAENAAAGEGAEPTGSETESDLDDGGVTQSGDGGDDDESDPITNTTDAPESPEGAESGAESETTSGIKRVSITLGIGDIFSGEILMSRDAGQAIVDKADSKDVDILEVVRDALLDI